MSVNTEKMNARLRAHDMLMIASDLTPEEQMGVLIMATVLACRRVLVKHNVTDGKRRRVIRSAAEREFADKLRKYTLPKVGDVAEPEPEAMPVAPVESHEMRGVFEVFGKDTMAGLHGAPDE